MSKSFRFNKSSLLALVKTEDSTIVRDSLEKGLKFKVGKQRSVFIFEKRTSGKTMYPPVTITIGAFPAISIEDARQETRRLSTLCEQGQDPRQTAKNHKVKSVLLPATAIFALKKDLRPRTLQKYRDVVKHPFPHSWMQRDLTTITPDMVVEQFHIARRTSRERCWEFLKVFTNIWNTCKPFYRDHLRNPILERNPIPEARNMLKHLKKDPPKRSVIPKGTLGKFMITVERVRSGQVPFGAIRDSVAVSPIVVRMCDIVLLSLFTAMRFREARCLRWE